MDNKNITFIGAGKMASAIIKGLLSSKTFDDKHIFATEVNEETAKRAKENFNIVSCILMIFFCISCSHTS